MRTLLLATLLALVVTPQGPQVEPGSVEGTLKYAGTGEPIVEALVRLDVAVGATVPTATTDQNGHFHILNVLPGSYNYWFPGEKGFRPEQGGGPRRVTVAPGQHVKGVEFTRVPAGIITGRVLGWDGTSLTGAQVTAVRIVYAMGQKVLADLPSPEDLGAPPPSAKSDNHGEFRLVVRPGEYYLLVSSPKDTSYGTTYFPGTTDFARARSISVEAGDEFTKADFAIQNASPRRVTGRIATDLLPAKVYLIPRDSPGVPYSLTHRRDVPTDGEFEFGGVVPGSYDLYATAYPSSIRRAAPRMAAPRDFASIITATHIARMQVDVLNTDVEQINVMLSPMIEVAGRVVVRGDSRFLPSESLWINLWTQDSPFLIASDSRLGRRLEASGDFRLPYVPEARYAVRIDGIPETAYVADVLEGSSSVLQSGIVIGRTPPARIEVVIRTDGGVVQGVVQDANQKTVAYTSVLLAPSASRRWNLTLQKIVTTDALGAFTIRGVAPGEYKIFAWEHLPVSNAMEGGTGLLPDEFISQFEEFGSAVKVEQAGHVENVQVRFIQKKR